MSTPIMVLPAVGILPVGMVSTSSVVDGRHQRVAGGGQQAQGRLVLAGEDELRARIPVDRTHTRTSASTSVSLAGTCRAWHRVRA